MSDSAFDELRALPWPTAVMDRPDPARGQLWRCVWRTGSAIVAVLAATDHRVTVSPASSTDAGDEHTILAETDTGLRFSLWTGLVYNVPTFVLDYRLGDVEISAELPARSPSWGPITSPLDDRTLVLADLRDELEELLDARWAPEAGENVDLLAAAAGAGLTPSKVATELGVTPGTARRILQGTEQPSTEHADALAALLGVSVTQAPLPEQVIVELDRPAVRPQLVAYAESNFRGDEAAARRSVAGTALALAARQRARTEVDWRARVHAALEQIHAR